MIRTLVKISAMRKAFILLALVLVSNGSFAEIKFNAFLESEVGYNFKREEVSKAEGTLKLEFDGSLGESIDYTFIPRVRFDFDDSLNRLGNRIPSYSSMNGSISRSADVVLEIAEAYAEFEAWDGFWTIGKQQVVWGEADGLKILDVVNPQDFREFNLDDFEDSRIPTWMINAEFELPVFDESTLQFLLIPDMTFNRSADRGTEFTIRSPFFRPPPFPGMPVNLLRSEHPSGKLEAGLRWSLFLDGWDLSFNYLNHFHDLAVVYRDITSDGHLNIQPTYQRNNLIGMSASNAFDDWVLRLELAYNSSNYHYGRGPASRGVFNSPAINSVVGLDYHGFSDTLVSYQWFQTTLTDYTDNILRNRVNMVHSIIVQQDFWNDTLTLKWFGLFDHQSSDGELRAEILYRYSDSLSLWAGVDWFYGRREGLFGEFNENDRLILGFKYGL